MTTTMMKWAEIAGQLNRSRDAVRKKYERMRRKMEGRRGPEGLDDVDEEGQEEEELTSTTSRRSASAGTAPGRSWTREEDDRLKKMVAGYGRKWTMIAEVSTAPHTTAPVRGGGGGGGDVAAFTNSSAHGVVY